MHSMRDNYSLGCAGLVAGTGATISIANAMTYQLAGRSFLKAATANVALAVKASGLTAVLPVLAASQIGCIFLFLDAAGNLTYSSACTPMGVAIVKVNVTAASGYVAGAFEHPPEEAGFVCVGAVKITTTAAGTFTIGTTALGAANTTAVFHNFATDMGVSVPF